jgi:hypothetical protein
VVAEAVEGTVMSDVANINILDGLFAKGAITLKTYIKNYPQNAIANRQKLLESIDEEEKEQMGQLIAQLQQAQAILQEQEQTINSAKSIVDENRALKEKLLQLQAEYSQKIQQANQILVGLGNKTKEFYSDAKEFAGTIANNQINQANQAAKRFDIRGGGAKPEQNKNIAGIA